MTQYVRNNLTGDLAPVNAELEKIKLALDSKLDRSPEAGQANQLTTVLDANSFRIINLPLPLTDSEPVTLGLAKDFVDGIVSADIISEELPTLGLRQGVRWYKPSEATTYVYYCDGDGCQWVQEPVANNRIESPFLTPAMFGAVGNGTNEQDKIQAMFDNAVGKIVVLEPNKNYGITAITIPDDVTLVGNFSKFTKVVSNSDYAVTIGNRFKADTLSVDVIGGTNDKGVRLAGALAEIGFMRVLSNAFDSQIGIHIEPTSGTIAGHSIEKMTATRFRTSILIKNVIESEFRKITCNDYITGLYCINVANCHFAGLLARFASNTAVGSAGQNGLLIESETAYATESCTFEDIDVRDSAEHGVRVGGLVPVRNLQFSKVRTRNTGSKGISSTGGQGFKILMFDQDGRYHENITVSDLIVEDCSTTGDGIGNFAGVSFGLVDGLTVQGLIVRRRNNPFSCWDGLSIYECKNANFSNIVIEDTRRHCIRLEGGLGAFVPDLQENIQIFGASLSQEPTVTAACIQVDTRDTLHRNISIQAVCRYGNAAFRCETGTLADPFVSCSLDIKYRDQVGDLSTPPVRANNQWLLNYKGGFYGAFSIEAENGSIVQDDAGNVRIRKAGNWVTL